jgi:hypothetical protein
MFDFDITKENLEEKLIEKRAKNMAKNTLSKMMTKMLLESNAPEYVKLNIRVLDKVRDVHEVLEELIVLKYTVPGKEANVETLKTVLEYLELVEIGIKQFVETTPYVAHTEEEEQ